MKKKCKLCGSKMGRMFEIDGKFVCWDCAIMFHEAIEEIIYGKEEGEEND